MTVRFTSPHAQTHRETIFLNLTHSKYFFSYVKPSIHLCRFLIMMKSKVSSRAVVSEWSNVLEERAHGTVLHIVTAVWVIFSRITERDCLTRCTLLISWQFLCHCFLVNSSSFLSICLIPAFCKCNVSVLLNQMSIPSKLLWWFCNQSPPLLTAELQPLFLPLGARGQLSIFCRLPDSPYLLPEVKRRC